MRHLRIFGLCIAVVFAVAAFTASSALAGGPEWGKCVAQAGGKYLDGNCQTKGKGGSFEWKKGKSLANVPFTGHNLGSGGVLATTLRGCPRDEGFGNERTTRANCAKGPGGPEFTLGTAEVECESEASSGEAEGKNKIANVNVTFKGCNLFGFLPCKGPGAAAGEIKTSPLKGFLGYINKASKEVGVVLEPATKHGHFAEFECGGIQEIVVGVGNKKEGAQWEPESKGGNDQVISPITPVNTMTSEYTQVYTTVGGEESEGEPLHNLPEKLEGKARSSLEDYLDVIGEPNEQSDWSGAGESITNVVNASEPGEIKG